jgi:carboxyl-terminal processing protease
VPQLAVFASLLACGDRDAAGPGEASSHEGEASQQARDELAPKSADCRSWTELDTAALPALPASEYSATFDATWRTVLDKHYDPTLACLDWPKIREIYGARVSKAKDAEEAYGHINAMLSTLGQSHLRAVAPGRSRKAGNLDRGPAVVPVGVRIVDGRAVVTRDALDGVSSGLQPGSVLVEVDAVGVQEEVDRELAAEGREVEKRLMAARAVMGMLHCPEGGHKSVTVLDPGQNDERVERSITCVMPAATESLGNLRNVAVRTDARMIEGTAIGYLAFNVWMVPLMSGKIRPALRQLEDAGMRGLILDLRGNPGGVGAMSIPMARELVAEEIDLGRMQMREMTQEYKVEPNPEAFTGPVVLLIDEGTASTSEIFAIGMRDAGRVSIVGASTSAGMALPSLMEQLPDGGRLQYVVGEYRSPKGTVAEGEGVTPDVLVKETREDFAAGKDPVLDAGVARLQKQLGGED